MNLTDGTLTLRAIEPSDSDMLYRLLADPVVEDNVVGWSGPVSLASQEGWVAKIRPEDFRFTIEDDSRAVGTLRIFPLDFKNRTGTVNIKLLPAAQGSGLGKRSLSLLLKYMFYELDLRTATATVLDSNTASRSLFESCGFSCDGILRSRIYKRGTVRDLIAYSILRSEFDARTK